jgi:hypothetical protein
MGKCCLEMLFLFIHCSQAIYLLGISIIQHNASSFPELSILTSFLNSELKRSHKNPVISQAHSS